MDNNNPTEVITKAIADLGAKHKEQTENLKDGLEAKIKEAQEEMTAKSIQLVKDEADKIREEYDAKEAKRATSYGAAQGAKTFEQGIAEMFELQKDDVNAFINKKKGKVTMDMKVVGDMSLGVNYTGGNNFTSDPGRSGIIQNPSRKLHIRDIPELPKGTMTGSEFPFMKENGPGEGTIVPVAEGTLKPQIDLDLIEASAKAEYIAGWLRVSKKMLADVPAFVSFLQARLLERLLIAEDNQLINGTGVSPQLSGITTAGNFTAAAGAATVDIEQLVQAISQLEELEREANAILLRPSDFWNIALNKAGGSGEYDLPGVVTFANGQLRVAGVPVYRTTAMTVDKFIVGDFRMGAMLLQREAPVIEFFEQDSINVRENMVTVRVEERIAFPIFGNNYFIYGDFGNVA